LNWGCIPTKALLRSAEVYDLLKSAKSYGLRVEGEVGYDVKEVVSRSRKVSQRLSKGVHYLLKKNKVDVFEGYGRLGKLEGELRSVEVEGLGKVLGRHVILATGARARELDGFAVGGDVWSYREAMVPEEMPKSLLVVGSGAIGMEFASFYRSMEVEVTVVEAMTRVLPVEDEEVSLFVKKAFEGRGMRVETGVKLLGCKGVKGGVKVSMEVGGKREEGMYEKVVMAVGIEGNVEDLGLEHAEGVKLEKSHIVTDAYGRTGEEGIYAIGDVAGGPCLAHKAEHEGVVCVERIAGVKGIHPLETQRIPGCTYTHPQVASVGLTESKARSVGYDVRVGRFSFGGNGKAVALGDTDGFVKTVVDNKTGEILGAHMVGSEVTELIQGYVIAMSGELTEDELSHTIFPHPTLSEMMHEAILDGMGRVIHQ
jgi:dihydrolipoamide dehydrogenase